MKLREDKKFRLKLKGKTAVFIDWANVYYWKNELKKEIDPKKLFDYLKSYKEIKEINLYFGSDSTHPASDEFLKKTAKIGYRVITKKVKFLKIYSENRQSFIWKRKCDFDLEIGLDCFEKLDKFDCFLFFSGDGDFATLYQRLIKRRKQVIVVYMYGHLGREIWEIRKGIFKASILKLRTDLFQKMTPNRRSGAKLVKIYHRKKPLSR
jgi:uncharacterized LabA/DUF88 family protein